MRIGIITLPLDFNYGGILQAYALEEVLRRQGCFVEHIEINRQLKLLPIKTRYFVYAKRCFQKYILGKRVRVFQESYLYKTNKQVVQNTSHFIDRYIKRRFINSFYEITENDYDAIIVGSDQIWRAAYLKSFRGYAPFLDFAKGWKVKKIAYACSFGTSDWLFSYEETKYISQLLKSFDLVTVREFSGRDLCKNYINTEAQLALDPTLLLSKIDYEHLINNAKTSVCQGNLMCYILDESNEKWIFINNLAKMQNLVLFKSNSKAENRWASVEERIQPPVEQWLRGFRDADIIVTDSFHACVFSIIFNKPFLCLTNKKRGVDRFNTLLSLINQTYRLIDGYSLELINPASFDKPNSDLFALKEESITLLRNLL